MPFARIHKKENLIYAGMWLLAACLYLLHEVGSEPRGAALSWAMVLKMLRAMLPYMVVFLINNFVLIRLLLERRRTAWYFLAAVLLVAAIGVYQHYAFMQHVEEMRQMFDGMADHARHHRAPNRLLPMPLIHDIIYSVLTIGINLAVALISRQVDYSLEREKLVSASMESRLDQLKAQINPHFYMNMLNNIHGLIEIDPAAAQDMVCDMSRLMRYMLYDSARERIALSAEITFLADYMRLMRQRYPQDKVSITSDLPTPEQAAGISVPPLLFLVFIENAFKHGVSYRHESFVAVSMRIEGARIHFVCINSRRANSAAGDAPSGIGLPNVRQRLELLFGTNASLHIASEPDTYIVNLSIPIA